MISAAAAGCTAKIHTIPHKTKNDRILFIVPLLVIVDVNYSLACEDSFYLAYGIVYNYMTVLFLISFPPHIQEASPVYGTT